MLLPIDCRRNRLGNLWLLLCLAAFVNVSQAQEADRQQLDFFESFIRPVLVQHCYECHSTEGDSHGGLLLDSQPSMRQGGSRGDVLAGKPNETLLWQAISYEHADLQMPPQGKLPPEVLEHFRQWIDTGAVDPRKDKVMRQTPLGAEEGRSPPDRHWAYVPPQASTVPLDITPHQDSHPEAPSDPIDAMLLQKRAEQPLVVNGTASRAILIRRLYYDLLGLLPSHDEVAAFERNASPRAYEELVESLMASPHYGERMARRWMDLARYADTKGYVFMEERAYPHAYRYREWLIRAFNHDMPYDTFLKLQIAGDHFDPENKEGNLDAMGMLTLGRRFLNNPHDIADDRIDVVTRGLMGMTVGCARCHDHKYDPIVMADYYSLHGVFLDSEEPGGEPSPMRLVDRAQPTPTHIFLRGQPGNRGDKIERHFVRHLSQAEPRPLSRGSGRLDLAEAIVDPRNPLTGRVFVNRVWDWFMGSPLVETPSDFGVRTAAPLQQPVLDQLVVDWIGEGWSTKRLVERIVLSQAYRRASDRQSESERLDPENRYWWRANRRRMDLESYRDGLLQRVGALDRRIGGVSETVHESPYSARRTLYALIDRQNLPAFFRTFDFASPDAHAPRRVVTTVPQQGLFALNSDWIQSLAIQLASRLSHETVSAGMEEADTLQRLYQDVYARPASQQECEQALAFLRAVRLDGETETGAENRMSEWALLAQALLIANECCFVD